MDTNIPESPGVRDPHNKLESSYNDMDSGYQSFEVKNSSITLAATHSTPLKKSMLSDLSVGFTISRGSLLQDTIDEVPSNNTPKKRKSCVSASKSLPKKLKIYSGSRMKAKPSSKRKLIPDDNKPIYIPTNEGRPFIDYLSELNQGYSKVLMEIFRLLSAEDLHNMTLVSQKWSAIINENTQADLKIDLKNFRHKLSDSKENLDAIRKEKDYKQDDFNFRTKKPFSLYNKKKEIKRANTIGGGEWFSSPSKKAAIKNDWVFSTIFNKDDTTSCPHCCKVSRITMYKSRVSKTPSYIDSMNGFISNTHHSNFLTSHFQYDSPDSSPSSQYSSQKEDDDPNIPVIKCGECTNEHCKFKFCLECLCEFHAETPCIITKQISPSKEEIENGILQSIYSPSSSCSTGGEATRKKDATAALKKRAKKSLKRLCF